VTPKKKPPLGLVVAVAVILFFLILLVAIVTVGRPPMKAEGGEPLPSTAMPASASVPPPASATPTPLAAATAAPSPVPAAGTAAPSAVKPRAQWNVEGGTLLLMPMGEETVQQLGAPSCLGLETDYSITGYYDMVFRDVQGTMKVIQSLGSIEIIQRDLKPLKLDSYAFKDFKAYAFIPRYTDCHYRELYLYGVKDGEAFALPFDRGNDRTTVYFDLLPVDKPVIKQEQLVMMGGFAAGADAYDRYTFSPDLNKRLMTLVNREKVQMGEYTPPS